MESIETSVANAIKGLEHRFSLDELDGWNTTNGLCKSIVAFTEKVLAGTSAHLFYHEATLHEYREIDREGLASVGEDTLFIGCLSMMTEAMPLQQLFSDFQMFFDNRRLLGGRRELEEGKKKDSEKVL